MLDPQLGGAGCGALSVRVLSGQSICQQHLIHGSFGLGLLLLTVSPLSLRLRLGLVGTPRFHVLLGLGLAPSSSAPVLPPLTARFAAFSSDFCFSCSLYAARAN